MTEPTDEELMISYQEGDQKAFDALYERYAGRVFGFLKNRMKGEVDDVHQSIFMKLHDVRHQFKKGNYFGAWVFTIAKTTMIDHLRKRKRHSVEIGVEDLNDIKNFELVVSKEVDLGNLSEAERKVLEMRYFESKEFEDIAIEFNTSPDNARQLVNRAVKKLRKEAGVK